MIFGAGCLGSRLVADQASACDYVAAYQRRRRPKKYDPVRINTKTGKIIDGNTRVYEIQKRGLDVDIPVKKYTPDDSAFPDLKTPHK